MKNFLVYNYVIQQHSVLDVTKVNKILYSKENKILYSKENNMDPGILLTVLQVS